MDNPTPQNSKSVIRLPVYLAIGIVIGILLGTNFFSSDKNPSKPDKLTLRISEVVNFIRQNYVDTVNAELLTNNAIEGILAKLDPHSTYIAREEFSTAHEDLDGNFEGIGVEFNIIHDTVYVVAPLSGGPSEALGIRAGDKIIKVEKETIAGIGINSRGVMKRLRGKKGTVVNVGIQRKGVKKLLNFNIRRDKIPTNSVEVSYMIDSNTGYIKISRFALTTHDEFVKALNELKEKGITQLLIDLRNNPGGYMNQAVEIADELITGNKLIVYTHGREEKYNDKSFAGRKGLFEDGALVILIDEGSASASEIVAGAIQDNDRGIIAGRRSFGKGLVQIEANLSDSSAIRLTTSRYYIPSGRCIQKPYNPGELNNYYDELGERATGGEYLHADSIKIKDTTRFYTSKGRVVYGGGGIIPDVFIPADTSFSSFFLLQLFSKDLF
ncbi:MAG TPA: S41 family peptidase, partial [Ignavibacteria bacterium]|nr:S41 family peptidase [Ignavibacteria bacterium]